jgi:predicted nicotinamide N-methyase
MQYPLIQIEIQHQQRLFIPDPEKVKFIYEQQLAKDPLTPFPFWAKIWASSTALSDYVLENPQWVQGKNVLEIGAGIGLPSFTIAQFATHVLISDYAIEAVELMQKNIAYLNSNNIQAACLDWNHFPNQIKADTVLLSDINYAPEQFESLLHLLKKFIAEGSTIILATPQRIMGAPFIASLQTYIQETHACSVKENEQAIEISILLLRSK